MFWGIVRTERGVVLPSFAQVVDAAMAPPDPIALVSPAVRTTASAVALAIAGTGLLIAITSVASGADRPLQAVLVLYVGLGLLLVGLICAGAGLSAAARRRAQRAVDQVGLALSWLGATIAIVAGLCGASVVAGFVPGPAHDFWQGWRSPAVTPDALALSLVLGVSSVCFLALTAQMRFPDFTGLTSFRRGSVMLPIVALSVVAIAYAAAVLVIVLRSGTDATSIYATVVVACATASVAGSVRTLHVLETAKSDLLAAIDDLVVALAEGDESSINRCALRFNLAYSRRPRRHPLLPLSVRTTLDLLLSRAITVPLTDVGSLGGIRTPALRDLDRDGARQILRDGCLDIRAALRQSRR